MVTNTTGSCHNNSPVKRLFVVAVKADISAKLGGINTK